jgi:hypothetical protein
MRGDELAPPVPAYSVEPGEDPYRAGVVRAVRDATTKALDAKAVDLVSIVKALQAAGVTSLSGIAEALNARGIPTPAGRRHWYAMQVSRLLKRLAG